MINLSATCIKAEGIGVDGCRQCQERVAIESLLSISQTERCNHCQQSPIPTPPPSETGPLSPAQSESEDGQTVAYNMSIPVKPAVNLKRNSKLAQVNTEIPYYQILALQIVFIKFSGIPGHI